MLHHKYPHIAVLVALSTIAEIVHLGYRSPTGIWIDLVAIPWIMAFFLFGIRGALLTSLLSALTITCFGNTGWLGASIKWLSTLPILLTLYAWPCLSKIKLKFIPRGLHRALLTMGVCQGGEAVALPLGQARGFIPRTQSKQLSSYIKRSNLLFPLTSGTILRCLLILPIDYYFAIPIFTGMTTTQAFHAIPWYIIVILNILQSVLEVMCAWLLVFRFKLYKFASLTE